MQGIVATFDACVLFQVLSDLLLSVAEAEAFDEVCSDAMHAS